MKLRKPISIILAVIMALGVLSVTAQAAQSTPAGMIDIFEESTQFYSENRDIIEAVYQGMMNYESSIDVSQYRFDNSKRKLLYDAVKRTHPELFFAGRSFNTSYYQSNNTIAYFKPDYICTQEQAQAMLAQFYEKADFYLDMVNDDMDEFTKAIVLHDALDINCTYIKYDESGNECNNYTFMVEGWGVCENYSEVYAYLLAQLGIKSEIITSDSMSHQWMKIQLDGSEYYYNVDITWDDPLEQETDGSDRPGKVYHNYFLLSDEEMENAYHSGYSYVHTSDSGYDDHSTLHSLSNPLFYIDGELYTLYVSNHKGHIATYDHLTDTLTDVLDINDIWYCVDMPGYHWQGCYSGICERDGVLYFNGENCVYTYNPVSREKKIYLKNALDETKQLYGLFMDDGKLMGLESDTPNEIPAEVDIVRDIEYKYNVYDEAAGENAESTVTKTVALRDYTSEQLIELNMPKIKSAFLDYSGYTYTEDGNNITVNIGDTQKKYTVDFNGTETEHSYLELVTLNSDEECSFIIDGRVVAVGSSYSFYVGGDTTVTTGEPQAKAAYSFVNLNSVTINNDKVTLDMLATANVGEGSYQRMGVAFALSEKTDEEIIASVEKITTGTGTDKDNKIAVHNSRVDYCNQSGQYQFRYAPYFSIGKAKEASIYFYTYVVTDDGIIVSEHAEYDMRNLLA